MPCEQLPIWQVSRGFLKTEMCGMVVLFSFSSLPALPQLGFCHVFTTQDCLCLAAASFERSWSRTWCNFRSKKAMSRTPCPNLIDQKKSCRKLVKCWDASRLWSMSKIAHRTICFDLPRTILSHPWKPGKFTLLVYRELTTWENDKRKKNDNVILGNLKRYGVFIQPHIWI